MLRIIYVILTFFTFTIGEISDVTTAFPARQGVHVEWYRTVCPGDNGSAIFVWSDTRYGVRNVFAHKISKDGILQWGPTGAIVTNLPGRQEDPVAIQDGSGGAFISWVDYRFDEAGDIFIQHIDFDGQVLMNPEGVALARQAGQQISINMCTDSLGGVFVTWQDKRGGVDDDIYGTHVSFNHDIVEPGVGVPIVALGGAQAAKSIEYAGDNEAFVCWSDARLGENINIYGQRINTNMEPSFEANGIPIAETDGLETRPRTTFVKGDTSLVVWKSGDENAKILFQFIDKDGLVFSSSKSILVYDAIQTSPRVKRSKDGDVFVQWKDLRSDPVDGDIYMQKVNSSGDIAWQNGVRVDSIEGVDFSGRFAANPNGGFDILWEKGVYPETDILFQSFDQNGNRISDQPVVISNENGYQFAPNIITGNSDSVFVVYADQSSGSIDLKIHYLKGVDPIINEPLTVLKGLDGDVKYINAYTDGTKNVLLLWEDNRASKKIYGNRLADDTLTHFNGSQITYSDNSSTEIDLSSPIMINTQSGIFTATFDATQTPKKIRINKLTSELGNVWGDNGIALAPQSDQRRAYLVDLGNGGVGCFWSETSRAMSFTNGFDVYFQKIDNTGNIELVSGGVAVVESSGDDYIQDIIPSPDGGFLIFWIEEDWPASRLKFNKIDENGNTAIGWPSAGYGLSNQNFSATKLQVKSISHSEGVLAVWNQVGNFNDIYAQKINWDGSADWQENGISISTGDNDQSAISFDISSDGSLAFIAWEDYSNGSDFNIVGKSLDISLGGILSDQIYFSSDTTSQQKPLVTSVAIGEFIIIWEDGRGYYNTDPLLINGVDLYGSAFVSGFGRTTGIDGIPIVVEYHNQRKAKMTKYNGDDFLLHWIDLRSSGKEDLSNYYMKTIRRSNILRVSKNDTEISNLPNDFALNGVYPNPFNGKVTFDFSVFTPAFIDLKIYSLTGRLISDQMILSSAPGEHRIFWGGKDASGNIASSGIYYYQINAGNSTKSGKITFLK